MNSDYLDSFIGLVMQEDLGDGDHTSLACIPSTAQGKAKLLAKQDGIIAGVEVAKKIFEKYDAGLRIEVLINDGSKIKPGDVVFYVEGSSLSILQAERPVLNVMQRMSGIATHTNLYVKELQGLHTRVLDTRKTTPGMRLIDKAAVKLGGGENHRIGLFDMIMIKDNHVDFAGGIEAAISKVKQYLKEKNKDLKIEIEVRSLEDVAKVLEIGGIDRIMLDNFTPEQTRDAVALIAGRYETESSGGITLSNIRQYAECGVDFISVGALTHQIKSLDLSLKAM